MVGGTVLELSRRFRKSVVNFAQPGQLFEDLGITYIGVVPGHDLHALLETLGRALDLPGPTIVHVRTQKGRGFRPAEADQVGFHGAALPPIDDRWRARPDGTAAWRRRRPGADADRVDDRRRRAAGARRRGADEAPELHGGLRGRAHRARPDGSADRRDHRRDADRHRAWRKFQAEFPDRMFDVGIAEQHAVTMATGLAMGGMRPVVALYSTFLQRAFDQTVHDVCQNDQPVLIAVDRAGLVGEDGTSHQGMFTLPAQRQLPNLVIASPKDEQELRSLLHTGLGQDHPFALHYPRDAGFGLAPVVPSVIPVGRGEVLREGRDLLFVGFGPIVMRALEAADDARGRRLVDRGHQRPLRAAARPPAHPRPGPWQADGRDLRGERRDRRLRERRARAHRGGAPGRPGLSRDRPCASWASPASDSSTTGPSRTCAASSASMRRVSAAQVREALETLRATPGRSEVAAG